MKLFYRDSSEKFVESSKQLFLLLRIVTALVFAVIVKILDRMEDES